MKKSFFFAALVVIMCAFSSCVDEPTIIGKWQMNTMKRQLIMNGQVVQTVEESIPSENPVFWQFVDESTGKMIQSFDGDVLTEEFTYTLTNNVLTITPRNADFSMTCQVVNLTETELILTVVPEGEDTYYQITYNLTRVTE
ncbi:MAG: lipocalin family protein [Paludibacteraceae bacterium]|nr:lipocalin family protein [Paludibacteraceae bacterium]